MPATIVKRIERGGTQIHAPLTPETPAVIEDLHEFWGWDGGSAPAWTLPLQRPGLQSPVVPLRRRLVVPADREGGSSVICIDIPTGAPVWRFDTPQRVRGIAADEGRCRVLIGVTNTATVLDLDMNTGASIATADLESGGEIAGTPANTWVSGALGLYRLDLDLRVESVGPAANALAATGGLVTCRSGSRRQSPLRSYDLETGELLGEFTPAPEAGRARAPVLVDGRDLVFKLDRGLMRVALDGTERWRALWGERLRAATSSGRHLMATGIPAGVDADRIWVLDPQSGDTIHALDISPMEAVTDMRTGREGILLTGMDNTLIVDPHPVP